MLDALTAHLENTPQYAQVRIEVKAHARSAQHPTYFQHCTAESFIPHATDLVIFEAGANMYDGKTHLERLLPAFRGAAPHAAVVLIFWARALSSGVGRSIELKLETLVRRDAKALEADAIFVSEGLAQLSSSAVRAAIAGGTAAATRAALPACLHAFVERERLYAAPTSIHAADSP